MKLYRLLFEQSEGNPYIQGFQIKHFTPQEEPTEELEEEYLAEDYQKIGTFLFEAKKGITKKKEKKKKPAGVLSQVRKAISPLGDVPGTKSGEGLGLRGRALTSDEVEDYITAAAGEKLSPEQRRTMPAMHQITAKNLLIPLTRLVKIGRAHV